jgi:precorrin-6B C5,15-methyltransferase / cobalt-precorrin-6B C5,C15-methyltransferase
MSGLPLVIVGIGHDGTAGLSAEARSHVEGARILAGGKRHLDFFRSRRGDTVVLGNDVPAFVEALRGHYRDAKTVVLASGDPLFYGIGRALLDRIPRDDLLFLPHVSSVQLAFARIKETWHDARVVSLHGRPAEALVDAVEAREPKIAVLTDARNHPAALAELLRRLGAADDYTLWVCENLGGPDERVSRHSSQGLQDETFSPLNVVVLVRDGSRRTLSAESGTRSVRTTLPLFGIPDAAILRDAAPGGMITRREARLVALCYLELQPGDTLWDVGAGTGSVSIEAARRSNAIEIVAVERDAAAFARLERNVAEFAARQVRTVCAAAPEGLVQLPDPDAVFIGGSGGRLAAILQAVAHRLKPGGRVVLNFITLEHLCRGWETLRELGLDPEATSLQLAHSRPLGSLHCMEPENPITIVRARKV